MGQQIIRQPDGKLAVFSSVVDAFVVVDATPEEIIEWRAQEAAEQARERTRAELARVLDSGDPKPYRPPPRPRRTRPHPGKRRPQPLHRRHQHRRESRQRRTRPRRQPRHELPRTRRSHRLHQPRQRLARRPEMPQAVLAQAGAELIASEAAQLDDLFVSAMEVLERDHVVVSHGKVVTDTDGTPLLDDGPKLAAIREMRAIRESYRKLLGVDAARRSPSTGPSGTKSSASTRGPHVTTALDQDVIVRYEPRGAARELFKTRTPRSSSPARPAPASPWPPVPCAPGRAPQPGHPLPDRPQDRGVSSARRRW
jgi:hypothetical protein